MHSESINRKRQQFARDLRRQCIQTFKKNVRKQLLAENIYSLSTSQQSNSIDQKEQQKENGINPSQQYHYLPIQNMVANQDFKTLVRIVPLSHILRFVSDQVLKQQQRRDRTFSGVQFNKVNKIAKALSFVTNQHFKYKRNTQNQILLRKQILELLEKTIQLLSSSRQEQQAQNLIQSFIIPIAQKPDFYQLWDALSFISSEPIKNRALVAFSIYFSPEFISQKFQSPKILEKLTKVQLDRAQIHYIYQFYFVLRSIRQFINSPPMVGHSKLVNLMAILMQTMKNINFLTEKIQQPNNSLCEEGGFQKIQQIDEISQRIMERKFQLRLEVLNESFVVTNYFINRQPKKHFNFLLQTNKSYICSIVNSIQIFVNQIIKIEKQVVKRTISNYYYLLNLFFSISKQFSIEIMKMRPQLIQRIIFHLKSIDRLPAKENTVKMYKNMLMLVIVQSLRFIFQSVFSQISCRTLSLALETLLDIFQKDSFCNVKKAIGKAIQYPIVILKSQEIADQINQRYSFQQNSTEKVHIIKDLKNIFRNIVLYCCIQICEQSNETQLSQSLQKLKGILVNIMLDFIPQKKQIYMSCYHLLIQYNIQCKLQQIILAKKYRQSTIKEAQIIQRLIEGIEQQLGLRIASQV